MLTVLARAARLLGAHWPALLAWILGGTLVHFLALKLAAFVGAGSAVGGIIVLTNTRTILRALADALGVSVGFDSFAPDKPFDPADAEAALTPKTPSTVIAYTSSARPAAAPSSHCRDWRRFMARRTLA